MNSTWMVIFLSNGMLKQVVVDCCYDNAVIVGNYVFFEYK